ncbi:MAG TPA: FAD-binding oxidoreductase [Paludibaculum sp.]|jgi:ferredoxin-NADP reductase
MNAQLLASREIAPEVRHFLFEIPGLETLEFTAGQFVSFTEDVRGRPVTRAYSLAAPPKGNRFELCLNRVREGLLSPWIFQLKPGDTVQMRGPLGYFVPRQPFRDSVFIATGTGIAPFRAFLGAEPVRSHDGRVTLLFGARYAEGLLYRAEFDQMVADRPGFRFLPTITQPAADWAGRTGRVQHHLEEALDGRTGIDVYICGLKAMVDEVRDLLKARGFDRKQIISEKYD